MADCDFNTLEDVFNVGDTGPGEINDGFCASFFSDSSAFNCETAVY